MPAIPIYRDPAKISGRAFKILVALAVELQSFNAIDAKEFSARLRMSKKVFIRALEELGEAGLISYTRHGDWLITPIAIRRGFRTIEMERDRAIALQTLGPSDVKLFFVLCSYTTTGDARCWPSARTLTGILSRTRRTLQRATLTLREMRLWEQYKVDWRRIRGFQWGTLPRYRRRKVTLFVCQIAKMSPIPIGALRTVGKAIPKTKTICPGAEESGPGHETVLVKISDLPEELRSVSFGLPRSMDKGWREAWQGALESVVGFSARQAQWLANRCTHETLEAVLHRLHERRDSIRDRLRYAAGMLTRLGAFQ